MIIIFLKVDFIVVSAPFKLYSLVSIKHLIEKYSLDVNSFEQAKKNYYAYCNSLYNADFNVEKSREAYQSLCNAFAKILEVSVQEAEVKSGYEIIYGSQKKVIPCVGVSIHAIDCDFTIGLFREFYIITELKYPQNIKLMKDDFWQMLFQLAAFGKFGFREIEKPTKGMREKVPQLFNKQGNYFKLLRNYFLYEMEYCQIRSLGYITVTWNSETPFKELIVKLCETFKIMYHLNFALWKADIKREI